MSDMIPFTYGDQPVRVVSIDDEPWFVLADLTPESSRRSWRIRPADLDEWVRRGCPTTA